MIFISLLHLITFFSSKDIDECERLNGGCEHSCGNTIGSYHCSCNGGYELSENGHSCAGMFVFVFFLSMYFL